MQRWPSKWHKQLKIRQEILREHEYDGLLSQRGNIQERRNRTLKYLCML
jgi:hypothetical protein